MHQDGSGSVRGRYAHHGSSLFFSNAGGASTSAIPNSPSSAAHLLSRILQMSEVLPSLVPVIILQHRDDLRGRKQWFDSRVT